jgi:hypothetical protein
MRRIESQNQMEQQITKPPPPQEAADHQDGK